MFQFGNFAAIIFHSLLWCKQRARQRPPTARLRRVFDARDGGSIKILTFPKTRWKEIRKNYFRTQEIAKKFYEIDQSIESQCCNIRRISILLPLNYELPPYSYNTFSSDLWSFKFDASFLLHRFSFLTVFNHRENSLRTDFRDQWLKNIQRIYTFTLLCN